MTRSAGLTRKVSVVPEDVEVRESGFEAIEDGAVGEGKDPRKETSPCCAGGRGEIVVDVVVAVEEGAGVGVAGAREGEQMRQPLRRETVLKRVADVEAGEKAQSG